MTVELTALGNGLKVVTHHMPHAETTALGLWVGAGARHEDETEHGICHFLEHMSFKGTVTRSAQAIAEEIEAVGGELNAATGLEATAYYARVLKGDEGVAVGLIADILLNSRFAEQELEREREVILQEIAATRDSPDDLAYELAHDAAFPAQAVGRSILGTPENVRAFSAGDLRAFLAAHYTPDSMVLAAAGAVNHGPFVRHAEALFGGLTQTSSRKEQAARYGGGARWHAKRFEQSHLVVAFEGPSYREKEFFTVQVFSGLFGGGMSSRLFQEVREKRGLCYSIYSSAWGLKDTGMFAVHAATGAGTMAELIDLVGLEMEKVGQHGPTPFELARSKAQIKAGLMMGLESSPSRAEQMARQLLSFGRLVPPAELVDCVESVSIEGIGKLARRLAGSRPSVAVVGAGKTSEKLAHIAADRMRRKGAGDGAWHS